MLNVPVTLMLPVFAGRWQSSRSVTGVVAFAVTLKVALPAHRIDPSIDAPVSVILNPVPAGKPPMTPESVVLADTSRLPALENPEGPAMA